jgi:hypothetical protein
VIVSFTGTPHFTASDLAEWKAGDPHLIVVDSDPDNEMLRGLIASNIVAVAITPLVVKGELTLTAESPTEEWFNRHFQVITRDNLAKLTAK